MALFKVLTVNELGGHLSRGTPCRNAVNYRFLAEPVFCPFKCPMHAHPGDPISLNLPLLQSRFPDIAALARKRLTLDEIGETLALRSRQSSPTVRVMGFVQRKPDYSPESEWLGVKREICDLLSGTDAESAGFHRLLRDGSSSATLRILSALSLRIAGTLGISVKRTTPLVAVALHDMARHGAQAWCGEIPA